jgi:hypothetical protein
MLFPHMRLLPACSEFKRREKAARVAKEREEKKARTNIADDGLGLLCNTLTCLLHGMQAACIPAMPISMAVCHAQAAAAAAKPAKPAGPQLAADEEEDVDPNQYFERRVQHVAAEKSAGRNPYPHKFAVSHRIPDFIAEFNGLESGSQQQETTDMLTILHAAHWLCCGSTARAEMSSPHWLRRP